MNPLREHGPEIFIYPSIYYKNKGEEKKKRMVLN